MTKRAIDDEARDGGAMSEVPGRGARESLCDMVADAVIGGLINCAIAGPIALLLSTIVPEGSRFLLMVFLVLCASMR